MPGNHTQPFFPCQAAFCRCIQVLQLQLIIGRFKLHSLKQMLHCFIPAFHMREQSNGKIAMVQRAIRLQCQRLTPQRCCAGIMSLIIQYARQQIARTVILLIADRMLKHTDFIQTIGKGILRHAVHCAGTRSLGIFSALFKQICQRIEYHRCSRRVYRREKMDRFAIKAGIMQIKRNIQCSLTEIAAAAGNKSGDIIIFQQYPHISCQIIQRIICKGGFNQTHSFIVSAQPCICKRSIGSSQRMTGRRFQRRRCMLQHHKIVAPAAIDSSQLAHRLGNRLSAPRGRIQHIVGFVRFVQRIQRQAEQVFRLAILITLIVDMLTLNGAFQQCFCFFQEAAAVFILAKRNQRWNMIRIAAKRFLVINARLILRIAILIGMHSLEIQILYRIDGVRMRVNTQRLRIVHKVVVLLRIMQQHSFILRNQLNFILTFSRRK